MLRGLLRGSCAGILVATVATATVLVAAPVGAVTPARDRIAVGDSVMLGARPALKERGFAVDAAVSRQSYSAPALLRAKGRGLPRNVVVHLGTNGSFPLETCRKLVRTAGPDRRVFLVTVSVPRSWEAANNRVLRSCARSFAPDRVTVVDWKAVAQRNPGWFYSDRVHLKPAGAEAFARLIDTAVDAVDERAGRAR